MKGKYQRVSASRKESSSLASSGPYMGLCESRSLHLVPCLCGNKWGTGGGCGDRQRGGEHLAIIKSLEKIRFVENQTEGLLEMIRSLRKHGMETEGSRDRGQEWVKLGALGHLVDIASELDIEVDESRIRLVCVATAVLLRACPGNAVTIYKFLECVWKAISRRPGGRGAMAVYRLFLTMLNQPEIRQAAIEAGFVNLLQARFRSLSSEEVLAECRVTTGGDAVMSGRFRDDLFRWQSSSGDERISRQPCSRNSQVVPQLNLGRMNSWWRGPSEGLRKPHDGDYAGFCNASARSASSRGLFVAAELRLKLVPPSSQVSFGQPPNVPGSFETTSCFPSLFNNEQFTSEKYDSAVDDTLILWEEVQNCTFHTFGNPRMAWDLQNDLLFAATSNTPTNGVLVEKAALLEACLVLCPMGHPWGGSLIADPTDMVIEEMCLMAENRRVDRGLVKCCGALMGEYSASLARVGVGTEAAEILPNQNSERSEDRFLSFVRQRIRMLLEEGKSSGVFPNVAPYIDLLRMYLKDSPSLQPATCFLVELGGVFGSLERFLVAHGKYKVQCWPIAQLKTFSELLELYTVVLERTGHSVQAESLIKRLMRDQVFLHLVREYGKWLVGDGRCGDVTEEERETWHGVLWGFLTELAISVKNQMNCVEIEQEDENQNIGWEHCFRKWERELSGLDLKQWDFLLKAKTGLVSLALANHKWEHASEGMDQSIHTKVVGFLRACFSVPDSTLLRDNLLLNFYIQLHMHRFRAMYERTTRQLAPAEWELCNLHLEVVLTIIKHRHSHVLTQLQHFKFAEYLTEEIGAELKRTELVPVATTSVPPGGKFPEVADPLFQRFRTSSSVSDGWDSVVATRDRSWGNNLNLQSFKVESQKFWARQQPREDEMSIEDIEKIVYNRDSSKTAHIFEKMGVLTSPPASVESLETIKVPDLHTNSWSSPLRRSGAGRCEYDLPSQSASAQEWSREGNFEGKEFPRQPGNSGRETMGSRTSGSVYSEGESDTDDDEGLAPSPIVRRPFCVPPLALKSFKAAPRSLSHASDGIPSAPTCSMDPTPRIERNDGVHATVVDILLEYFLLADEVQGSLRGRLDLLSFLGDLSRTLFHHLNARKFGDLEKRLKNSARHDGKRKMLLLRMFLTSGFDISAYKPVDRIHHGDRAQVQRCHVLTQGDGIPSTCVIKAMDFPMDHALHRCILDMLSEIAVLEKMRSTEGFCELYDFGASAESIFLVMKDYPCSLLEWRNRVFPKQEPHSIRLLLRIFRDILSGVEKLHSASVVHFDLKCSNILLDPDADFSDDQFWDPDTEMPPFSSVISDFGEARCYEGKQAPVTMRHRGTEHYQSPEMLKMRTNPSGDFDRRQTEKGAGFPCDVWALGCLLFELITGEVLQFDTVFMKFYYRVTGSGVPVIDEAKARLLHESYRSEIIQLLEFILVRDQNWRPSIGRIIERVDEILSEDLLPAFQPAQNTLVLQKTAYYSEEKTVFRDGVFLGLGMRDLTERVSVFLGSDVHRILNSTFLLRNGVTTVLLTKDKGCEEQGGVENVVLGMCSRMSIEGVFLVDLAKDEWDGEMLVMKKNMGLKRKLLDMNESKQGRVLICGNQWGVGLFDFTVMVLNKLEGMSNFEALLTVRREGL